MSFDQLAELGLLDEVSETLRMFTVLFIAIADGRDGENIRLCGSGTLANFGGRMGVLTADHVLQALPLHRVGISFPGAGPGVRPQRLLIEVPEERRWHIGRASNTADGPDLGFLELVPADVARLPTTCAFYDIARRRDHVLAQPRAVGLGGWYLCGAPDEWTTEGAPLGDFKVRLFGAFCGALEVLNEREVCGFDLLDGEVNVEGRYDGPMNFKGVSGGGLWQIVFSEIDGEVRVRERLLSGVAFYQLAAEGKPQTVVCHGRRSIYCNAWAALAG